MLTQEETTFPELDTYYEHVALSVLYPNSWDDDDEPITREQIDAVRSSRLGRSLRQLNADAQELRGSLRRNVLSLAVRFYEANGMRYRFGTMPGTTEQLNNLWLWCSPSLNQSEGREGPNSLHHVDRDELRTVAAEFLDTGFRCIWFERMLVECMVAAEVFALREEWRSNSFLITGRQTFIWQAMVSFAYEQSKGASPKYDIYLWIARLTYGAAKLAALAGIAILAVYLVDSGAEIRGYLVGLLAAVWAIKLFGQYVVRWIVWWTNVAQGDAMRSVLGSRIAKMVQDGMQAHRYISHDNMSPYAVRELLLRSVEHGLTIDPIVFCYLDRAIVHGEFRWTTRAGSN
jgi:hypothetical protein